jgi:C-terminal processing protease CtpA/Prc
MQVFPVGGELMVMSVSDYSPAGQSSDIRPGSVILEINGQPALDYFEATPAMIFSTGHPSAQAWSRGDLVFRAAPGTYFRLKYRQPDGQVSTTALQTIPVGEIRSDPPPHAGEAAYYEVLPSGLGLIGIQNFTSSQVDDRWNEAMAALLAAEVPGLIIDLRRNGGGFGTVVNYILGDFLDEDVYAGRRVSSLDEDGDGLADTEDQIYFARARRFDPAKVIVLVGPECYSACEFAALAFQTVGAQVMGHTQTGGAGGGVGATYYLPNGIQVYGMAVVRMEDPAGQVVIEGQGVPLDVVVPFNPQDLSLGQDTLLRAAEAQLLSD